jgi:hypothetical protein
MGHTGADLAVVWGELTDRVSDCQETVEPHEGGHCEPSLDGSHVQHGAVCDDGADGEDREA